MTGVTWERASPKSSWASIFKMASLAPPIWLTMALRMAATAWDTWEKP